MDLSTATASNIIALSLGLIGVWLGSVQPRISEWRARRHAHLSVRFEYYWRQDTERMQSRFVIHNGGPAPARNVELRRYWDIAGDEVVDPRWKVNWVHPVDVLQPGQDHHLIVEQSLADKTIGKVVAHWKDDAGLKDRTFALSPRYP